MNGVEVLLPLMGGRLPMPTTGRWNGRARRQRSFFGVSLLGPLLSSSGLVADAVPGLGPGGPPFGHGPKAERRPKGLRSGCPGLDSNQHSLSATRPSSVRVYQFHHLGIGPPLQEPWRSRGGKYRSAGESVRKQCQVVLADGLDPAGAGPFPSAKRHASGSAPSGPGTRRARRSSMAGRHRGRCRNGRVDRDRIFLGRVRCSRGYAVPCGSALAYGSGDDANLSQHGSGDNTH